jgi:hypothetical protein
VTVEKAYYFSDRLSLPGEVGLIVQVTFLVSTYFSVSTAYKYRRHVNMIRMPVQLFNDPTSIQVQGMYMLLHLRIVILFVSEIGVTVSMTVLCTHS